ncbi:MAG: response regulator [Spirochaetia bacterium]|nr:response regulator [Spirochaetia bacterium]
MKKLYRCLIVEDEPSSANLVVNYLKEYDDFYAPKIAQNISEAMENIKHQKFDLIFCDIHLPDGNAMDLMKSLDVTTPLILITGDRNQSLGAYEMDAVDYIVKPVSSERFNRALKKMLQVISGRNYLKNKLNFVDSPERADQFQYLLINRYKLSQAESAICYDLVCGKKTDEITSQREISYNTFKSHMKRIYAKTIDSTMVEIKKSQGKLQRLTLFLLDLQKELM